jgi:hypothetical protein
VSKKTKRKKLCKIKLKVDAPIFKLETSINWHLSKTLRKFLVYAAGLITGILLRELPEHAEKAVESFLSRFI